MKDGEYRDSLNPATELVDSEDPAAQTSLLKASNAFLNREIAQVEAERDGLQHELAQIRQSYGWKVIERYRQWLIRIQEQHAAVSNAYEAVTVWVLNRLVGSEDRNGQRRYRLWIEQHRLALEQREEIRVAARGFPNRPLISVLIHVGANVVENWITRSIESVRTQVYDNWELCLFRSESVEGRASNLLDCYVACDPRIRVKIVESTDEALGSPGLVKGEFVVVLEPHGELASNALFELVKRLNRDPLADLIYWDDDRLKPDGSRTEPFFKPDWDPDLLLSMNYLGPSVAVRRSLLKAVASYAESFDEKWLYDLALRAVECTDRITHIPDVLYHQRTVAARSKSGGGLLPDTLYAPIVADALRRRGLRGTATISPAGHNCARYEIRGRPLVSILIPTRDHCELLRRCLKSIDERTNYQNFEVILLDNDSSALETLDFYKTVSNRVRVCQCPGPFNFSAINNRGAKEARGEFLLFLNNDTEVIAPEWLGAMIEQAQRAEVGAVGAKLLYEDGRIQHAGIVLGIGGLTGHAFRFTRDQVADRFGLVDAIRTCSAVTAACMMMRRELFEEHHGFEESLPLDFNDVDLCLRLRASGYRIVYQPLAQLYHFESATRGKLRSTADKKLFLQRWASCIRKGDPYYNRNLTLSSEDWGVAI